MTQKTTGRRANGKKPNGFSDVEFIDLALDKKQEQEMVKLSFSTTNYYVYLNDLVERELKLTLKKDARNLSIMAMVQSAVYDPDSTTTIWVMRSGTAGGALLKLAYWLSQNEGELPDQIEPESEDLSDDHLFA